ncbi:MAG: bifunctional protein FolD [Candidatus Campbellbacteria bacterium]
MLIDGRHIGADVRNKVATAFAHSKKNLTLGVLSIGGDAVTEQFIRIKKKAADAIGIPVIDVALPEEVSTDDVLRALTDLIARTNAVVVQLPLPAHVDRARIFSALPASHDVDCLGDEARASFENGGPLLPPVVAACKEILERYSVAVAGKSVVVVGRGVLVGAPAAKWFSRQGAAVNVLDENDSIAVYTQSADIIVLGAGHPGLLKPDMIQKGVVVLDAGTSESGGRVIGDADPACAEKALLLTPVPGGVGPVAVAKIFENLLICNSIPF